MAACYLNIYQSEKYRRPYNNQSWRKQTLSLLFSSLYGMRSGRYVCSRAQNASPSFQLLLKFVMSIPCMSHM